MRNNPEYMLAREVSYYLKLQYPDVLFRFDMAGLNLSKSQAGMNKAIQNGRGFPDLVIYAASGNKAENIDNMWKALMIELKPEGTRLKKKDESWASEHLAEQAAVHRQLVIKGYYACFACGFDEVDRLIKMYSNPGELVADPFGGVCTTGVRALKHGRKTILTELNETYAKCGNQYLKEEELKRDVPTLFDLLTEENKEA